MTLDERIAQINAKLKAREKPLPKPLSQRRINQMARDLTHVMCSNDKYSGNAGGFMVDSYGGFFRGDVLEDDYSEESFP